MRLWSVHPKYLDVKGLGGVWQEALLAQKVLWGESRGYRYHPQLQRFQCMPNPKGAIAAYLWGIWDKSFERGYHYNNALIRIERLAVTSGMIKVTTEQVRYEFDHLCQKLSERSPALYEQICDLHAIEVHPLFEIIEGGVELWEKQK